MEIEMLDAPEVREEPTAIQQTSIALVQGEMVATSGGSSGECKLKLYTAADTTDVAVEIDANVSAVSGDTTRNSSLAEIELTSAQVFAYDTDIASSSLIVATVDVLGWLE